MARSTELQDRSSLAAIVAYARSGAANSAWSAFEAAGLESVADDPLVLTLKGRLLKDKSKAAVGGERVLLLAAAGDCYLAAAKLQVSSYALINAATLALLAGDIGSARQIAEQVLKLTSESPEEPETRYYRAATRAEALLLLGRGDEGRVVFAEAIALAPEAWEDHASTLRQFRLILDAQGEDAGWLDTYRPPRSLHFGGHMSFDGRTGTREELDEQIDKILEEENIGFGFGALAAGADIIIAEALAARGAQLHAILPGGVESFAAVSVDPFGPVWRARFDALIEGAEEVRAVRPFGTRPGCAAMIALADEVAMGAAVMNARQLESSAVQLLVLPEDEASASDRSLDRWARAGWRQRLVLAPREIEARKAGASAADEQESRTLAILALPAAPDAGGGAAIAETLTQLKGQLATLLPPVIGAYWSEARLILAYEHPSEAAEAAARLLIGENADPSLRIGGHYGLATVFTDPFSGQPRLTPDATGPAAAAMDSTPPGTACVTEDFAAALAAAGPRSPATEYVGELDAPDGGPPIGLHALKSYDQLFEPLWGDDAQ